jgi:hypothetical protein
MRCITIQNKEPFPGGFLKMKLSSREIISEKQPILHRGFGVHVYFGTMGRTIPKSCFVINCFQIKDWRKELSFITATCNHCCSLLSHEA